MALMFKNLMIAVYLAGSTLIALAIVSGEEPSSSDFIFQHPKGYVVMITDHTAVISSGIAWPIQLQHEYLKSINWAIVGVRMIEAIEGINVKGFTFSNPVVYTAFEYIFMHFSIFSLITYLLVKYKQ